MVNGKIVNIDNIKLFEKAMENIIVNRVEENSTIDLTEVNSELIADIVSKYNQIYKSIPFPLYGIDSNIKYVTIAKCLREKGLENLMWVENGLKVCVDKDKKIVVSFINNTWAIKKIDYIKEDNIDIEAYKEYTAYKEFKWLIDKIGKGESTASFYVENMGEFIKACNEQPMVLKWELANILNFGRVPKKLKLKQNRILDIMEKEEYMLDIYLAGTRKTSKKIHSWDLTTDKDTDDIKNKLEDFYDYKVYKKSLDLYKGKQEGMQEANLNGIMSVFLTLCGIKAAKDLEDFEDFTGLICDNNIVFEINGRIFVAKSNKYVESREIARDVEIYAYDRGLVYLLKKEEITMKINKETIYSYSLNDGSLRLCKIQFIENKK